MIGDSSKRDAGLAPEFHEGVRVKVLGGNGRQEFETLKPDRDHGGCLLEAWPVGVNVGFFGVGVTSSQNVQADLVSCYGVRVRTFMALPSRKLNGLRPFVAQSLKT